MTQFNTNPIYLASKLFDPIKPKTGAKTILNMTALPDYLAYLKQHLTKEELLLLSDYHLQNLLMEYSVGGVKLTQQQTDTSTLNGLTSAILEYIRQRKEYWLKKSNANEQKQKQHLAIETFNNHMEELKGMEDNDLYNLNKCKTYKHQHRKKIYDDYRYWKYPYLYRNAVKYSCTIYPFLIEFIGINDQERSYLLRECILYYMISSKSKSKNISNDDSTVNQQQETNILSSFVEWLNKEKGIEFKISSKQQCFYRNILEILKYLKTIENYNQLKGQDIQETDIQKRYLNSTEVQNFGNFFYRKYCIELKPNIEKARELENLSKPIEQSDTELFEKVKQAKKQYEQLMNHPNNITLGKYKVTGSYIPWEDHYYQIFLKCLKDTIQLPTNNRKIAQEMSKELSKIIEPNHVKYAKGIYYRNMTKRIQVGECGGGKRGKCFSKEDFVSKDLQNFNIRYFRQIRKDIKKRRKIKKKDSSQDDIEQQSVE